MQQIASQFEEYKFVNINNWSVISPCSEYTAPELIYTTLYGKVYNHNKFNDGTTISTSKIVILDLDRKFVKTYSGTWYRLLSPNKKWIQWLRKTYGNKYT